MAKKKFWTTDKIVGFTALFISILTLYIFIRQTNIIETQSHLSVMPYLLLEITENNHGNTFELDLENYGVGPAIIENASIHYNDSTYKSQFQEFLRAHVQGMDSVQILNHSTLEEGRAIPAGGSINLITVGGSEQSYTTFLQIMQELKQKKNGFDFDIQYKSIYEDQWQITLNSQSSSPKKIR